jgi:hypothetical protein
MNNPIIISIIMSVVITLLSELYYRYKYKDDISIDDKEKLKIQIIIFITIFSMSYMFQIINYSSIKSNDIIDDVVESIDSNIENLEPTKVPF